MFAFDGNEYLVGYYAKYLIEYLEGQFKQTPGISDSWSQLHLKAATSMTVFHIPGDLNLRVQGHIDAEAVIPPHHEIIHADTDIFVAVLRLDYGGQFATVHPNQESLPRVAERF